LQAISGLFLLHVRTLYQNETSEMKRFREVRYISTRTKSTSGCQLATRTGHGFHMLSVVVVSPLWKDG